VSGTNRTVTIQSDFIGVPGTGTNSTRGRVTLTDARTGAVTTLTQNGGGVTAWTPGTTSTPDTITITVPPVSTAFPPGPKELSIVTANSNPGGGNVPSVNGITLHVLGSVGGVTYNPPVVNVAAPPAAATDDHTLQNAINGAAAGSLLVLGAGTYNENVLVWKPLKIQGLGPGGVIGAHELQGRDPEDPRFNIKGSIIDGRFFQQNAATYDATVSAHAPNVLPNFTSGAASTVLRGADLTVVAKTATAFDVPTLTGTQDSAGFAGARIDGLGVMTGHGDGAGGIQLQASVNNMQLTNNILENNGGIVAGGIGLGQPYVHGNHNYNVRVANSRLIGNGGLTESGAVGIFYGSNNYDLAKNVVCSNFSVNYGAGVSHIGLSPGGRIRDSRIYYNDSVDSGAGIAVESELPVGSASLGDGSGTVDIDRNLVQSNFSGDDGGGLFVLDALKARINVRNNMIVNNGAADIGAAVMLDDASNVSIANNTVANNVTTDSSENSLAGVPHAAGLASEANDPAFQATLPAGAKSFSDPVALFNNIFWNNQAQVLDQFGPGATLSPTTLATGGYIDFEVHGTTNAGDTFTPRYSDLTNGQILGPDGALHPLPSSPPQGNTVGADPGFVQPFVNELAVSGSRLDPQAAAVTITGADPPVGLTGDYHIALPTAALARVVAAVVSPVVDRGAKCSTTPVPATIASVALPCPAGSDPAPTVDIDGQTRPRLLTNRITTPWDRGADESTLLP
jgi:hypothetical protein